MAKSVTVKITNKDRQAFKKEAKEFFKRKGIDVDRALDATALDVQGDAQRIIHSKGTTDRGFLGSSIKIFNTSTHKEKKRKVATTVGYGKWVELGRPPGGMPPITSILGWVKRKLNIRDDKAAKSVAYLISKAIAKRGTKAQPFLLPSLTKNKRSLTKYLKREFKRQ